MFLRKFGRLAAISQVMACGGAHPPPVEPAAPAAKLQLAVIPAESDAFPGAARALSASLASAKLAGVDETRLSKASLEVVQLSIECVDATDACYQAIGRSMAANRLLFARIDGGAKQTQLKVTVTLYDVDARAVKRTRQRTFDSEGEASAGAAALVAEVTR
jgi:hypothetical protein